MTRPLFSLSLFLIASLALAAPLHADEVAPSSVSGTTLFHSLPRDPAPEEITRNQHYWISNEQRLDLFHDHIKDLGGVYIGVGSDQNYLHAGWAKTEVLVLMDFDQKIVDLHGVYRVAFLHATTKEQFMALWSEDSRKQMRALIKQSHPVGEVQKDLLQAHKAANKVVSRRFRRLSKQMIKVNLPSFVTDDATYNYIRGLYQRDKVFMVRGDLTATTAMKAIAAATEQSGLKVRVLYLSNAEQYFNVRPSYRDNIVGLPTDDKSLVIRTNGWRGLAHIESTGYHYNVQSLSSFKLFVAHPLTRSTAGVLKQATPDANIYGFSTLTQAPADTKAEASLRSRARKKVESKLGVAVAKRMADRLARDEAGSPRAQARAAKRKVRDAARDDRARVRREARAERKRLKQEERRARKSLRAAKKQETGA